MPPRTPDFINRAPRRLNGALKPQALAGNGTKFEVVNVGGAAAIAVRIKASGAGTLSAHWCGPDTDYDQKTGVATVFTEYTSGNPADVTVTGGTEATLLILPSSTTLQHCGESFLKIIFLDTSAATNTISYVDLACRTGAGT